MTANQKYSICGPPKKCHIWASLCAKNIFSALIHSTTLLRGANPWAPTISSMGVSVKRNDGMDEFYSKHKVLSNIYYAALLHDHPQLLNDCCELINMEWKRSHTARLRSISGSSDNFPTSIILLKETGKLTVVGHCKLTKLSHCSPVIFIESVVIHPEYRGKGLGKLLMLKAECYLKSKNIEWIYLSTLGQEVFYEKLGYSTCDPINIYGGQISILNENDNDFKKLVQRKESIDANFNRTAEKEKSESLFGIPPPPPLPCMPSFNTKIVHVTNRKTFMRKRLL